MTDTPMLDGDDSLPCEIHALVQACLASTATPAQRLRLERLVCENMEARRLYVHYMHDSLMLRRWATTSSGQVGREVAAMESSPPDAPFPTFLGSAIHGTVGYVSSGWPVAYLAATAILGVALWIASLVHVSEPAQVARQNLPSPSGRGAGGEGSGSQRSSLPSIVGRITGMVDCQWQGSGFRVQGSEIANPKAQDLRPKTPVSLGDTFSLASGLLEITYDNGAKVILQGPVTYEVESTTSGFLSLGKLTARMDKGLEIRDKGLVTSDLQDPSPKAEDPKPESEIPHPLFSVRTPTATVTDLGTEFGVEVKKNGTTRVHVLQGVVETREIGRQGADERPERVVAGTAVEVGRKAGQIKPVTFSPQSFARTLQRATNNSAETAYINAVLADKPLGYWPLNERAGARKFLDRSGNGFHGYAMKKVTAGQPGPLSGNSHAVGLNGNGYIDVGRHDEFAMANDFTVEAWVCIGESDSQYDGQIVAASPGPLDERGQRACGWVLEASGRSLQGRNLGSSTLLRFCTYAANECEFLFPSEPAAVKQWQHVAVVCDRGNTAHFYLNGKQQESIPGAKAGNRGPVWVQIGGGLINNEYWRGRLAHVAVYPRALSQQQIENHYKETQSP